MQEKIICENDWQYFYLIPLKKFSKIQWKSKNFKIVSLLLQSQCKYYLNITFLWCLFVGTLRYALLLPLQKNNLIDDSSDFK